MIHKPLKYPLFKSSIIYAISDGINKSIPFFILPVISHFLLPAYYSIVANFGVLTRIIGLLLTCGMEGAISVNLYKIKPHGFKVLIFRCLIIALSLFLLLLLSIVAVQTLVYQMLSIPVSYRLICVLMCLCSLFTTINLVQWLLEDKPLAFGLYDLTNIIINIFLSVLLDIVFKQSWVDWVNAIATISYGMFSLYLLYVRGYKSLTYNGKYIKDILLFGIPLITRVLSFWLRSGVCRIFWRCLPLSNDFDHQFCSRYVL